MEYNEYVIWGVITIIVLSISLVSLIGLYYFITSIL
jgi:hypothetical protein